MVHELNYDDYKTEIEALEGAESVRCLIDRSPERPAKTRVRYDPKKDSAQSSNQREAYKYDLMACWVTVKFVATSGEREGIWDEALAKVIAPGVDESLVRDSDEWCDEALSEDNWENIRIIAVGASLEKDNFGHGDEIHSWACGRHYGVKYVTEDGDPELDWKHLDNTCGTGWTLHDQSRGECSVDKNQQVRLGSKEEQVAELMVKMEDAEESADTMYIVTFTLLAVVSCCCCSGCLTCLCADAPSKGSVTKVASAPNQAMQMHHQAIIAHHHEMIHQM